MPEPILEIRDLTVEFGTEDGVVKAVTGVSYDLYPGEVLGIVGESGSGKSVSMLSVLGLNQLVSPVLLRIALVRSGEAGKKSAQDFAANASSSRLPAPP